MAGNYLGRKAAYAMHKRWPSGSQSLAQIAAERANLAKARAAKGQFRQTGSVRYHGFVRSTMNSRAEAAAGRAFKMLDLMYWRNRPLDTRYLHYRRVAKVPSPRIYGVPRHFRREIAPSRYYARTAWGPARTHHFQRRVYKHSYRFKTVSHWKHRGRRYTPR